MKTRLLSILVGVISMFIGIAAVTYWFRLPNVENRVVETAVESQPKCKESRSFPGRSLSIAETKKFKGGFFPVNTFNDGWNNEDKAANEWYGKFLHSAGERSLVGTWGENTEIYRFLWLRTFHHPVMLKIVRDGYEFQLISVELSGAGGYEPGKKWMTAKLTISQQDWCEFMTLLENTSFWSMETSMPDDIGTDGSIWMLEGVRRGRYHIVKRWTPTEGDFREVGLFLIRLSGRDLKALGNDLY